MRRYLIIFGVVVLDYFFILHLVPTLLKSDEWQVQVAALLLAAMTVGGTLGAIVIAQVER